MDNLNNKIITFIKKLNNSNMLNNDDIIAYGRGRKIINGIMTNIPTLTFVVKEKLNPSDVNPYKLIPKSVSGITTDIIVGGKPTLCRGEIRPSYGGLDIGNWGNIASDRKRGTLAYAVTDKGSRKNIYLLSCNHVLTSDMVGKVGEAIIQPSSRGGGHKANSLLGTLSRVVPVKKSKDANNQVDAAIALVGENTQNTLRDRLLPGILAFKKIDKPELIKIAGIKKTVINEVICKVGSTTGKTTGRVLMLDATVITKIPNESRFINQVSAEIRTDYGDSGALVYSPKDNKAVGLLMANSSGAVPSTTYGYFNDITTVLEKLNIELL